MKRLFLTLIYFLFHQKIANNKITVVATNKYYNYSFVN